ncbi:hypothetical protein [Mesorhizobium sp. CAU 1741]|uniref:hypothetical protein n=1 Tax=Mesorhizobium sp. CAU 1741 TaxID=3140366 RepID=UPI00325B250C
MQTAMLRLSVALKAGFRPGQPRIPSGQPDGGQWTRVPGYAQIHQISRRRAGRGQIRIGGRWQAITPAQEVRLALSQNAVRRALREVRELDPNWKPPAQAYSTVEGLISANRAIELEARFRLFQLLGTRAEPGPYAGEWIPAPPTNRSLNRSERQEIDRIGRRWGCHRCGSMNPGTKSGSFIGDHQVPKSMGRPTRIYPHCAKCSASQGGLIGAYRRRYTE